MKKKSRLLKQKKIDYSRSGVDVKASDHWVEWIAALKPGQENRSQSSVTKYFSHPQPKLISGVGDYAAVLDMGQSYIALTCDGVGTKLLWTLEGLGSYESLAQDLLAMNTNDLLCVGAEPRLFLDYLAVGSKKLFAREKSSLRVFLAALKEKCFEQGILLVGGETAQLPDLYKPTHFDLAGFCVGFMGKENFLSIENCRDGDELWGIESSGPHSNGYTLLRKLFSFRKSQDRRFIEKSLMAPTRLYTDVFFKIKNFGPGVKAAFHITGSGWDNILRTQPKSGTLGYVNSHHTKKDWPDWVRKVAEKSRLSTEDLYRTFNMGMGFMLVVSKEFANTHGPRLKEIEGLKKIGHLKIL